jgi:hypothetical protein
LLDRWLDVYLNTTSSKTPVIAAKIVADNQPGKTPIGASSGLHTAFANAFSHTTT